MFTTMRSNKDALGAYLTRMGGYSLLTHAEEVSLGQQIQSALNPPKGISQAELDQIQKRGQRAKHRMICGNLRLVVTIAKKYQKRGMDLIDLIQEGSLGLERAVEKFDPAKGYRFSTYAYWWIRQSITRAIAMQSHTIRIPVHMTEKLNRIKRVRRELSQTLGRTPTHQEMVAELGITLEQLQKTLQAARISNPESLNIRVGKDQEMELGDLLEDLQMPSPNEVVEQDFLRNALWSALAQLNDNERTVLILRYGLEDGRERSLYRVSQQMGISREWVRKLEQTAKSKLLQSGNLQDFMAA
ncbi:sigma-70 family RNA polymerase sigma factor [Acaryochloris sp. CCMEE 5410]|uniref:sigma-70 family RNA polymerase sigma factor n=1 Tax=Acaryochloris sp. CCMEE 5410 TaxID=310037 RepID=UPI0002484615|nr:sigma-70 family RNA polymerase sigma factor [Acaryochloris sp. CCMEE 5410]KAI9129698.1 sigma-70 family RNA polymerase sigma factor [Acaryochloris sp. CCMEE 5410]